MDHIFFYCYIARVVWYCIKEALGWDRVPRSLQDVFDHWIVMGEKNYHVKLFMSAIVLWGLWNVRTKMGLLKELSC